MELTDAQADLIVDLAQVHGEWISEVHGIRIWVVSDTEMRWAAISGAYFHGYVGPIVRALRARNLDYSGYAVIDGSPYSEWIYELAKS